MPREKKEVVEEEVAGAPEWMVTFSDCMTLLLTFFVLLLSFSSFSDVPDADYKKMTVSFADRFPSVSEEEDKGSAMRATDLIQRAKKEVERGSEIRPAVDGAGKEGGQKKTEEPDFHQSNIFMVASEKMFWGKGVVLSAQGRAILKDMASFINEVPNRIVISECKVGGASSGDEIGLQRAWTVIGFLKREGVKMDRLNMSSVSTIISEGDTPTEKKRFLQIVLLERGTYR
jgi:chemotaxis protein MotB